MITVDGCDLCQGPLGADMAQLDFVAGSVFARVDKSWGIAARPSGLQHYTICLDCRDYLKAALAHMRGVAAPGGDAEPAAEGPTARRPRSHAARSGRAPVEVAAEAVEPDRLFADECLGAADEVRLCHDVFC